MYKIVKFLGLLSFLFIGQEVDITKIDTANLTPQQIEQIRSSVDQSSEAIESPDFVEEESLEDKIILENQDPAKFGYSFLNKTPTTITPVNDLPVPNDYVISLRDKLSIILSGARDQTLNLTVLLDGNLQFPDLGLIPVVGETLQEVREKLTSMVSNLYPGTKVSVSIRSLSAKKITIIGAVNVPGTYLVNPFTTISNALAYSGGVLDYGSLRNIELIKASGEIYSFDLYDLLVFGDRSADRIIEAGDTIAVGGTSNFVKIDGEVIRPQIYEYSPNDKFSDLIKFTLGLNRLASTDSISVNYLIEGKIQTRKVKLNDQIGDTKILDIFVGSLTEIKNKNIFVNGSSVSSGYFDIKDNQSFKDFLNNLSFSDNLYPFFAVYKTRTNFGLSLNDYYFSLADESTYSSLDLQNNSELLFFSRSDMFEPSDIENLDDYLINGISIILPDDIFRVPLVGKVSPRMVNSYIGENAYNSSLEESIVITDSDIYVNAYDQIFDGADILSISIPPKKAELISVEIAGEVRRPGIYSVSSGSTLRELYAIAGGILESGDDGSISFFRESIKESQIRAVNSATAIISQQLLLTNNNDATVDLESFLALSELYEPQGRISGDYSDDQLISREMILRDNDKVFVPTFSNVVILQGEVNNNSAIIHDPNASLSDYIERAGGFTDFANKQGVYIIRSNGSSVKVSTNLFSDGDIAVKPGDTIVVPRKIRNFDLINSVSLATKIISDIAFSTAALNAIQN